MPWYYGTGLDGLRISGGMIAEHRNGFEKWVAENGTGHVVRKHFNGIDYAFATMNDGWIAIFEVDDGMYIPKMQAADEAHADSWCYMIERPRVQFNVIWDGRRLQ